MNVAMKIFKLLVATVVTTYKVGAFQTGFSVFTPAKSIKAIKATRLLATVDNKNNKVGKTDEEWKQELTPEAYYVLREAGTERPNSSELNDVKEPGTFVCRGCGAPLFTTSTKFDSGTGWPSFYRPIDRSAVNLKIDYKLLLPRTEVICSKCDGHLGHVFEDGPEPTGQRYCMNGVAMDFKSNADNPDLESTIVERENSEPFKPTVGSQIPGIVLNGAIGAAFFASFVSRISDIEAMGGNSTFFDYLAVIPAVFYGVLAARGMTRLL